MINLVLSLLCVMLLMGGCCDSSRDMLNQDSNDPAIIYDSGWRGEKGTVRALEAIRQELVLFRKDCYCSCPAGVGK